ncbi:MAG TPA: type II CAAX endopeptidase family protein, partial [Brevundimonas sp.]|nr:type II CAAX endopeptidase family protein [Brevundimonas sp.]
SPPGATMARPFKLPATILMRKALDRNMRRMQRCGMFQRIRNEFRTAMAAAARSTLTEALEADRPWLRLGSCLALAALLTAGALIAMVIILAVAPGLELSGIMAENLPRTPTRLFDESAQVLFFSAVLGVVGLATLGAAALTYRRRMTDFLWPGRRFAFDHLWIGFLVMTSLCVILIPFRLLSGRIWEPPILDPQYLDESRVIYAVAMVGGLLVAAAAEEVAFRGVLLRLTAQATRHPLVLCLINGVIFSAIHLDPDPVAFVARATSGAIWTWAALRLGGLEFAIGAHLANNLVIALLWRPFSEAAMSRQGAWTDLGPELFIAVVIVLFVERLAPRSVEPPHELAPRPAA